jgi:CheY-like chemotaxis protein
MNKNVLIVDDNVDILEPMSLILTSEGYNIETSTNEEDLYLKINSVKPDLILLDILISGSDGREICRNLKNDFSFKDIPIVMISAHPSAQREAEQNGADGFLAKPFEIDDLIAITKKFTA